MMGASQRQSYRSWDEGQAQLGGALPTDQLEVVQREGLVPRDNNEMLDLRLRDQHPIEGIAMMRWQTCGGLGVPE